MKKYGLIGFPVKHSFSPDYFAKKFINLGLDYSYQAYEIENLSNLKELVNKEKLSGFNVTIPYKKSIIPFLDEISKSARKIGAVNTVTVQEDKWIGSNTDHYGFRKSLKDLIMGKQSSALIFGNGGSAQAVKYALNKMGVDYAVVSRSSNGDLTYDDITVDLIAKHQILINTTPLGSLAYIDACVPIPYEAITEKHMCYDLIYTPCETVFLTKSKQQNGTIKNGVEMLELQADKSWRIWNR